MISGVMDRAARECRGEEVGEYVDMDMVQGGIGRVGCCGLTTGWEVPVPGRNGMLIARWGGSFGGFFRFLDFVWVT